MLAACLLLPAPGFGAEEERAPASEAEPADRQSVIEERMMVIGSPDRLLEIPGSAHLIDEEALATQDHDDVHRILRRVPGVHIQEEEGYGLRPNIGMRGTGVERSQKISLLEDGILIAPAPYSAPAAYYFPVTGRMQGIEVRKGSSSIKHGPYTNGGALNLLSRRIPSDSSVALEVVGGSDGLRRGHAWAGDSTARFGWLVEGYSLQSDGFKRLDGGGPTGFELEDLLVKLRWNSAPTASRYQSWELKVGRTDQFGHETYLGLTRADFAATPFRRYAASAADTLDTSHASYALTHFLELGKRTDLTSTVYRNDFARNWRKLDSVLGVKIANVLADPAAHAAELDVLRGDADSIADALIIRNNRRDYYAQGVQSILGMRRTTGRVQHEIEIGLRYHEDEEDRFQEEDGYRIAAATLKQTSSGAPGSQANRINRAEALALFATDMIRFGKWIVTPGLRVEDIRFARLDYGKADPGRSAGAAVRENDVRELIPGAGVTFRATETLSLFGGVHRGFSPPGPGADAQTAPEESTNLEVGARLSRGKIEGQLLGFYSDYDNLLGRDTLSTGGTGSGELFNGGKVLIHGLEASISTELAGSGSAVSLPLRGSYTYTRGEFRSSFTTSFADWAPAVQLGDELPYVPAHQLFAELGYLQGAWEVFLGASWVSEMRTRAGIGPITDAERIGAHLTWDLSAGYRFTDRCRAFVHARNLTDEVYVAARRPAGLRPGLPRSVSAGISLSF